MTTILDNPTFYISIFSSVCFVASELLPFLPIKGNGIIHAIVECLSSYNKFKNYTNEDVNVNEDINIVNIKDISDKIDKVIHKLDVIQGVI